MQEEKKATIPAILPIVKGEFVFRPNVQASDDSIYNFDNAPIPLYFFMN